MHRSVPSVSGFLQIIWLTQGQKPKRDAFYDFKGKKLTGEILDELNYQFMRRLQKEGLITLKELYIDGTKIEANANRYTFVWRGSINYHLAGLLDTIDAKERIKERIEEKALVKDKKRVPFPTRKKPIVKDYSRKNLIDTTEEKFTQSPGLKHWADIQNLKIAAASYSQAGSIAEFEKQSAAKSTLAKTARA